MRIIISPAKQMKTDTDTLGYRDLPVFISRAEELRNHLNSLSYEEQKRLWACSDKLAEQNRERLRCMDLYSGLTPALLAYDGIQYTYMAPSVFEESYFDYVQERLRILSGFYGVLRPMDGVTPYRLEMQAKAHVGGAKDLYDYWGDTLYREVMPEDRVIVNLASKEYSKCIERYLTPRDRFVDIVFGELIGDKVVTKGVYAKMARGEMVRYAAEIRAQTPEQLKAFELSHYRFDETRSTVDRYVFIRDRFD